MELDTAIREFVADLKLAGRAPRTIESHQLELLRLGRWCDETCQRWHELTRKQTEIYIAADDSASAPAVDSLPGLDSW
jgi:hypothetical protein